MKKFEYLNTNGKLYVREKIPDIRKDVGKCPFCNLPVLVSSGQLLKYLNNQPTHKKCR